MNFRSELKKNPTAYKLLLAVERKARKKIKFVTGPNEFDPNILQISISGGATFWGTLGLGRNWKGRILLHELGHAVIDAYWDDFDQRSFKRIFNGSPGAYYPTGLARIKAIANESFSKKTSVTRYGKHHAEEAWAEAFSHVLNNVEDADLDAKQIRQLAYVDWVVEKILRKKTSWGKYTDFEVEVVCPECMETFGFGPCRLDLDIDGWDVDCPYCQEHLSFSEQ